ncbi:basic amino acid ABC transporter substrate-binding protein [Zhenpiania hominis]|uniref:Basic amino acid ABC transporter substrate-binding protein n=1 Tax=Zhenpiania hominis TaxID=2763644 RepID=A0A923NM27_9FIRM|nr:basic amino acid ABC transporter substrate-binding protein [Zhenpiania hominis]MBC6680430.1 basic amino acid ABC transporter substrate-binding protein [Zhenpiania hominis]
MKKKSIIAVLLIVALAFSLAACGGGDSEENTSGDSEKVTYKVGTEPTFPPFDTTDEEQNIVGLDMDLIKAIGEDQGFEVTFENLTFDGLVPALKAGNIDIIAAGMNKDDPERQKQVDFSDAYYESKLMVAVTEDNNTIKSVDDLTPDMKVAAQTGTTGATKTQELADEGKIAEAVILDGLDTAMMQLLNGDVQAVINDKPVTEAYMKKQPDKIKMVGEPLNAENYGFAVQKGNTELLEKINAGLANIKEDGTFDKLVDEWFNK